MPFISQNASRTTLWGIKTHQIFLSQLLQYLTGFDRNWYAVSWINWPQSAIKYPWRSAWTQPKTATKFLQGSVATLFRWSWKSLSYFVANLSKTLHINFYQNQSSVVEVITKNFGVFYAPQCILLTRYTHGLTDKGAQLYPGLILLMEEYSSTLIHRHCHSVHKW